MWLDDACIQCTGQYVMPNCICTISVLTSYWTQLLTIWLHPYMVWLTALVMTVMKKDRNDSSNGERRGSVQWQSSTGAA